MGLREEILGAKDQRTAEVKVPEWNRTVTIRSFSAAERDAWEYQILFASREKKGIDNMRAKLAAFIVIDPATGERVFSDDDVEALGKKSGKALDRIFGAFQTLNRISDEEAAEFEKNS